jgi:hypothetical protein
MKKSKMNVTTLIAVFTALIVFNACQKNESLIPSSSPNPSALNSNVRIAPVVPPVLEVPAGNSVCFQAFATGVQIYVVTLTTAGYAWVFQAPEANLYANAGLTGLIGTHYAGTTWESISGSKVAGAKLQAVTVDATAIPWLLLGAVSSQGPGVLEGVTYIQRVNTAGGLAPSTGADASHVGEVARVPYTAEYYFYKAE